MKRFVIFGSIFILIGIVIVGAYLHQTKTSDKDKGFVFARDPIEQDPRYKDIFKNIDSEVDNALEAHPMRRSLGFIHIVWETKKKILREKYGIEWQSPAELEPWISYD